jgi:hypothetical protein
MNIMRRRLFQWLHWTVLALAIVQGGQGQTANTNNALLAALMKHQYNLEDSGRAWLIREDDHCCMVFLKESIRRSKPTLSIGLTPMTRSSCTRL